MIAKFLDLKKTFLTEMAICIVERWKKSKGYLLFLSAIMHSKVMHVHFFVFFPAIFAGLRFVVIRKFCYHGHVTP